MSSPLWNESSRSLSGRVSLSEGAGYIREVQAPSTSRVHLMTSATPQRRLGASGLLVSPICLGTMTFGSPVAEADAIRLTHAALDLGINFIDTANVYEG